MNMKVTNLYTSALFDSLARKLVRDQVISVSEEYGIIVDVQTYDPAQFDELVARDHARGITTMDVRHLTILPGFVDVHVHMFLHAYNEVSWTDQNTQENVIERTIRATVAAKKTLLSGYTAVRDLGTEGAGDADISLRKCISEGIIPGPRYFTANRAIVSTGAYGPKSKIILNREGVEGVAGAEAASGREACVEAVRRQIGAGADWIKIYADYRPLGRQVPAFIGRPTINIPLFNRDEMAAMIDTAHAYGVRVAAHASNFASIETLLPLGIDSVEHGQGICTPTPSPFQSVLSTPAYPSPSAEQTEDLTLLRAIRGSTTTWVPTLSIFHPEPGADAMAKEKWRMLSRAFQAAVREGLDDNLACGGDTGPFPHGDNALEMQLMRRLGAPWEKVLSWCTFGGYRCIIGGRVDPEAKTGKQLVDEVVMGVKQGTLGPNEIPFGVIRAGWAADIVGLRGVVDGPADEFERAVSKDSVDFVMKAGVIYKAGGKEVV
ncbi:hypothetical protein BD626DRAFT_510651 [Schizophyllum amplum]|uniref:Amidohydrolase-related domain-containing protein n=1 Tax=Schizophyllum amplum TaxID=97359 RepID=A0A550C270_9AGAR|nr:hypothetical protein BD626DRAFT_510651 [Auriculariopsis ampla]